MKISTAGLLSVSLVACTQQPSNEGTAAKTEKQNESVTIKVFKNYPAPEYPKGGGKGKQEILKALDAAGLKGIDYDVTTATGPEYFTKLNLFAASGELPDYFNLDIPTMTRFADEGLIQPLDDMLKLLPNAVSLFDPKDLESLKYKGHLYALPAGYRPEPINGPNTGTLIFRQDWLDNLGLQQPKTLSELHDVLEAFTKNDPDKNQKNDTYGLGGVRANNMDPNFGVIFGAFGVIPSFWHERNGQLKQGMVLPEAKEALALLQQWYKEGIIDPESLITEKKQLDEKIINSKIGVFEGQAMDVDPKQPLGNSLRKVTPTAKFNFLAPPIGPKGLSGWNEKSPSNNNISSVSSNFKNTEALMKLLDWSVSDKPNGGFSLVTYGKEGEHFTYDKEKNRILQKVSSYSELYEQGYSNPVRFLFVTDRRWTSDETIVALESSNKNLIKNSFWKTVPAQFDYPELGKLWAEYYSKIVSGTYSIDKWDEFVQKYYQQGGKLIEEQVNAEWKKK
ncbi:extracellular solute-binding protein [Paenibacillus sp. FSL H8-0034]|uniref:extracellular solute-binding protein n=1 Tax=Paenibacillus sp. FSL H8-0034 TaxID=2954671 RepID=UPI0030F9F754